MIKTGITGGIGSGKTTVCRIFESLGIPVYYADICAKQLMNTDADLKESLMEMFGKDLYIEGTLDRKKLSGIIFNNKEYLEAVNSLVHPAVARDFIRWCDRQSAAYILEETAILFESGMAGRFEKTILVTAPESLRVKRVCDRDHVEASAVYERMKNQWTDERKIPLADYIIYNDDIHMLIPQVIAIHRDLIRNADERSIEGS